MAKHYSTMWTTLLLCAVCCATLCAACSAGGDDTESPTVGHGNVSISVQMEGWNRERTRAGGMLYPINVLLVRQGSGEIAKALTVVTGTQFDVSIPCGTYDIYAVCGLPTPSLPAHISQAISVTAADFAMGMAMVSVDADASEEVNINASHQMAWLDLTVTDVPSSVVALNMYIKGVCDSYRIDTGWSISPEGESRLTQIPITQNRQTPSTYESSHIMIPSFSPSGVTYVAEMQMTNGYTVVLYYTSSTPMMPGTRLTQTLGFANMKPTEGNIHLSEWNTTTEEGTLTQQTQ